MLSGLDLSSLVGTSFQRTGLLKGLSLVQSAKAALAAALENAEGVREAVAAKEVLDAVQKSSTTAWRSHSVSPFEAP